MKNIIFDWSGVVKDAAHVQLWLTNKVFEKHGLGPLSLDEFKDNWEQPHHLFYNKYLPDLSLEEEAKDYREAILSEDCPSSDPYPGITDLIKTLKKNGLFLAAVSSDLPDTLFKEMREYGLENIFTEVITRVHDKFESVEGLIKEYNLDISKTFFVGDSNHEIDVAQRTGIKSIAVTWGFTSERRLRDKSPDYIVNNPEELRSVIFT